ncbi:hypothetical protein N2152v2_005645 [Parachlorella kessleri]
METTPLMLQRRLVGAPDGDGPSVLNSKPRPAQVVLIDEEGHASYTTLRKQALVTDLHLRHRDIRALDPGVALPYPSAIFVRKGALVLSLEGLKVIIGREKVLVISVPQLHDLSARSMPDLNNPVVVRLANHIALKTWPSAESALGSLPSFISLEELRAMQSLPYELRALEAALSTVAKILEREVKSLEDTLAPVLRRLTRQVRREDLEAMYDKQNKLDKVQARVTRIKEILEELLDDDQEMAGMCLSRTELAQHHSQANRAAAAAEAGAAAGDAAAAAVAAAGEDGSSIGEGGLEAGSEWESLGDASGGDGSCSAGERRRSGSCQLDTGGKCEETALDMSTNEIGECEDLMEAYWLQVDSLLSKLGIMQERIRNTQHLVNLDLDSKRNSLVALGLLVDLVLMMFETQMVFTGVFGMNLESGLEPYQPTALWAIAGLGLLTGAVLMVGFGGYAKFKGLLYMPSFGRQE